jgi:hypothetical protein
MTIFNQKPIINRCAGPDCNNNGTRASLYKDSVIPMWWCDNCDPRLLVYQVRFKIIATYEEALTHIKAYCEGRKSDYNFLIRAFARAKGLPKTVGEKEIQAFFHGIQLW